MRLSANNSGQQVTAMSLRGAVKRTNFHLYPPGIVPSASKVHGSILCRIVLAVKVNMPVMVVPPSSVAFDMCCTVV